MGLKKKTEQKQLTSAERPQNVVAIVSFEEFIMDLVHMRITHPRPKNTSKRQKYDDTAKRPNATPKTKRNVGALTK